ncbi:5'/3'-nucleotidase SurE [Vibrio sp. 10N.286.49.B1]|uniref:5'/3'-nucleotidase SurE n=1 Tax=unclassified Vibrio TaxID=2614977 RepID=UPI001F5331FD|nr:MULTISPECIES: 5'/3'-nucleotidase SurE [unclassified Vibrio]
MMNTKLATLSLAIGLASTFSAQALNIVLTNDDSWATENIQVLHEKLQSAGHDVIMAAPCTGQSGKGGAVHFFEAVNVDRSKLADNQVCVGDTDESVAYDQFVEGTPTMAALYGIDVYAQEKWGKAPDVVISGPNEGNNLGYLTNNSGTLGAANVSIAKGIPAIAVSAADGDATKAPYVAEIVVQLLAELVAKQKEGAPLLPRYTGLNVNTPADPQNHLGFKHTQVGWNPGNGGLVLKFEGDMADNVMAMELVAEEIMANVPGMTKEEALAMAKDMYRDKGGVVIDLDQNYPDQAENSEGVAVSKGYVTISTIEANVQATTAKSEWTRYQLRDL